MAGNLITYEEARERILAKIGHLPPTNVSLSRMLGHVTAAPLVARYDAPPFDNSAVDGFGVRLSDLEGATKEKPVRLKLSATMRAGDAPPAGGLPPKSTVKILTGGLVPQGIDAVIMREFTREEKNSVYFECSAPPGENIRRRGGEFFRGTEVLQPGQLLTPAMVALVANLGHRDFDVFRKPKVAVVTTGNELTKPGRDLMPGMIFDSNSYGMEAALRGIGLEDILPLHAKEDLAATKSVMSRALSFADVVISTGGVSVGDFDYVKAALESLGVTTELWRIAIKPGKPVYFGVLEGHRNRRSKYVFGLPGNPVSALVTYQQFVLPALKKLMGLTDYAEDFWIPARLTQRIAHKPGRLEFIRGRLLMQDGALCVEPTTGQDSHMLGGIAVADALIYFDAEATEFAAGQEVKIKRINWSLI